MHYKTYLQHRAQLFREKKLAKPANTPIKEIIPFYDTLTPFNIVNSGYHFYGTPNPFNIINSSYHFSTLYALVDSVA